MLLVVFGSTSSAHSVELSNFESALQALNSRGFSDKQEAINALGEIKDKRVAVVLDAMLNGNLYSRESDGVIVVFEKAGDEITAHEVVSNNVLADINKYDYTKIRINNSIRIQIRAMLAELNLNSEEVSERLAAVEQMMKDLVPESEAKLLQRLAVEQDEDVRQVIGITLALLDVAKEDKNRQLAAINALKGSLYPEVRVALHQVINSSSDKTLIKAAQSAITSIEKKIELLSNAETVFFGLSLGSVLLLSAIGLAITFGVMGVINMAHGELMMIGAYTTYIVQQLMPGAIDYSLFVAVPAAFVVSGLFGVAIERGVIRHLYGRPLETLLATFGVSLILQQLVRTTISAQNVTVSNPTWMSGSVEIVQGLSLTYNRLYILVFALLVFALLLFILKKTSLGLQVRAVTQNRQMARAMGIRSAWVDAMTFGLGSGVAGVAGVALSQLTNVGPNMGQSYIIDSFMVVVFGGVGNLWGTLVGAFTLGVANKVIEPWSGAVLAKILVLVFIILFIQKRPRGLFPQKGRVAEN